MTGEIHSAIGRITRVTLVAGEGIFLEVELQGFMRGDGSPLMARAKWCPAYAGTGFGDWHLPDVGRAVVVVFPTPGPHRASGGDLDSGFAVSYASFTDAPPIDGVDLALSATTRVLRGKTGVAEQRETHGAFKWFYRAAASFIGDTIISIVAADIRAGNGTLRKLLDERAMTTYNLHTHPGVQAGGSSTGVPTQQMAAGTHTTTHLTAS